MTRSAPIMEGVKKNMSCYDVWSERITEDVIIVEFRNWNELILWDSRKTIFDVPLELSGYRVCSVNIDDNLTIIEIDREA